MLAMLKRRFSLPELVSVTFLKLIVGTWLLVSLGCAAKAVVPSKMPQGAISDKKEGATQSLDQPTADPKRTPSRKTNPRAMASLHLTERARMLLSDNKTDEAIRVLEQAIMVYPSNGRNYYYLAEAWLSKGNAVKALEFNKLAGIYIKNDPKWIEKVMEQREGIKKATR
jgi:hypothetical protein